MEIIAKLLTQGVDLIPVGLDKRPIHPWKIKKGYTADYLIKNQIAIVAGSRSNSIHCIDIDLKNDTTGDLMKRLWDEMVAVFPRHKELCINKTPSGGYHILYKTECATKNQKLAKREDGEVLLETRGEGGYFLIPPSKGYVNNQGDITKLLDLSPEEHNNLLNTCRLFDMKIEDKKYYTPKKESTSWLITPMDDYDARNPEEALELLLNSGWLSLTSRGSTVYLKRPGKKGIGFSATWNYVPNRLYVFSTSTSFESERAYTPSGILANIVHNGNFTSAYRDLLRQGYGVRSESYTAPTEKKEPEKVVSKVVKVSDVTNLDDFYLNGTQDGIKTGWLNVDEYYTIAKGQLNIVTGIPSHGKSEFIDALMMNLSITQGWKFLIYSPENYPFELHIQKLAEKFIGQPVFGLGRMSHEQFKKAYDYIGRQFEFIDPVQEGVTFDTILEASGNADGIVIDPFNELEDCRPAGMSETDYIGHTLKKCRRFAREKDKIIWIIAHPHMLRRDKDGNYPIPDLYDISGSAHWKNKADNGLVVYRNLEKNIVELHVKKVKFKYYGKQGMAPLTYDMKSGRYYDYEEPF